MSNVKINFLELFAGSRSMGKAGEKLNMNHIGL